MLQVKTYKFRCSHCGGTTAHVRKHEITEYELIESYEDLTTHGLTARMCDKPVANANRLSYTTVICTNCRAEWGSLSQAGNAGNLTLDKVQTKRSKHFITEKALSTSSVEECAGTGDAVHCTNCEWTGIIQHGGDRCPSCCKKGCLSWQFDDEPEAEAAIAVYCVKEEKPYMIAKFSPACAFILSHAMMTNPKATTYEGVPIIAWQPGTLDQYIHGKTDTVSFSVRSKIEAGRYSVSRVWMAIDFDKDEIYLHCSEDNNPQDTPFPECETIAHAQLASCPLWALDQWRKEAVDFDTTP